MILKEPVTPFTFNAGGTRDTLVAFDPGSKGSTIGSRSIERAELRALDFTFDGFRANCRQPFPYKIVEELPVIRCGGVYTCTPMSVIYALTYRSRPMTAADFRRIALTLEGVEEYSHAGLPAFRVGGRKFASLASQAGGYGNLMLTLEQQAAFVEEAPEIFLPIPGGWGKMGHTHIRLAAASEDVLTGALRTAWRLRIDKNAKTSRKTPMWRSAAE